MEQFDRGRRCYERFKQINEARAVGEELLVDIGRYREHPTAKHFSALFMIQKAEYLAKSDRLLPKSLSNPSGPR